MKIIALRRVLPLISIGLSALVNAQSTPTFLDWTISPPTSATYTGFPSTLRNESCGKFLRRAIQSQGVSLGFVDSQTIGNISFYVGNVASTSNSILLGRPVSIRIYPNQFLTYSSPPRSTTYTPGTPDSGLRLSQVPTGEWLLIAFAESGTPAKPTMRVGLYNRIARDCLVFEKRRSGVSLGWSKNNKARPYKESYVFLKSLEKQGFKGMLFVLKGLL